LQTLSLAQKLSIKDTRNITQKRKKIAEYVQNNNNEKENFQKENTVHAVGISLYISITSDGVPFVISVHTDFSYTCTDSESFWVRQKQFLLLDCFFALWHKSRSGSAFLVRILIHQIIVHRS
jgi:hypothetical protein